MVETELIIAKQRNGPSARWRSPSYPPIPASNRLKRRMG